MNHVRLTLRRMRAEARDLLRYVDLRAVGNDVQRVTDFTHCARPVLLLPGFMASRRGLTVLERRLRRDGYCVFSLNLGGLLGTFNTRSIEETGLLVREKVERLYRRYDMGPLTVVGHSQGGLIGHYYVKRLGGHERARTLITLGSPHRGTRAAYLGAALTGLFAPSIWQLMPSSRFVRRLDEGAFPAHVQFASILSPDDRICPPQVGRIDEDAAGRRVNVEVAGVGHHEFLTRKAVYAEVRRQLDLAQARAQEEAADEGVLRLVTGQASRARGA